MPMFKDLPKETPLEGAWFNRNANTVMGFTPEFYKRAALAAPFRPGMDVLDLGCGTGAFGLAVAERVGTTGRVVGVDLHPDRMEEALQRAEETGEPFEFHKHSTDNLPFQDSTFDAVIACMALHEVKRERRRRAIEETARVLKPGGIFVVVDWAKPRLESITLFRSPQLVMDGELKQHWRESTIRICEESGMTTSAETFLNPLVRCQIFTRA